MGAGRAGDGGRPLAVGALIVAEEGRRAALTAALAPRFGAAIAAARDVIHALALVTAARAAGRPFELLVAGQELDGVGALRLAVLLQAGGVLGDETRVVVLVPPDFLAPDAPPSIALVPWDETAPAARATLAAAIDAAAPPPPLAC